MDVLEIGSTVQLAGGIAAQITAVCVYGAERVRYQVVWWDGRTRHEQWIESCELSTAGTCTMQTGFLGNSRIHQRKP